MARIATGQKRGAEALRYLSRVKESDPDIRLLTAEASYWAGQRQAATGMLDALGKEGASDPRLLYAVGLACARLGLFDRAETAFNAVASRYPGEFEVLLNLGRAAARAGHYDRARSALEVALKIQPGAVDALLELGLVHAALRDSSRAVFLLAQARQAAPKRPDILLALARAAEDAGYYGDSALTYDEYLKLKPTDDAVRRDRALVYGYTGTRLREGVAELTAYLRRHPNDPIGHYDLAQVTWQTEPATALEQLSASVRLDPQFTPARFSRAWLLHRLGRSAESLPDLLAAARTAPANPRILLQLGVVYLALDRPADAEKALRRALNASPDDPEVLMNLGRALMALNREADARPFLEKFRQVRPAPARGPRREAGMLELATLSSAERTRREIERLRRDARAHPGDPELQFALANLLLADGRTEDSLREFRELLTMNVSSQLAEQAGSSLLAAEQPQLAEQFLRRAVPERPSARLDLAIALFSTAGPQQSLAALAEIPAAMRTADYYLLEARILDAAGRGSEGETALAKGLHSSASRPDIAGQAALLLLRQHRPAEALDLLDRTLQANLENPELWLTKAAVLGLLGRIAPAEKDLNQMESRWPEWDRPYLAHGLLLEHAGRGAAARQKFQTALALGASDPVARCALARIAGSPDAAAPCACLTGLEPWLTSSCNRP